MKRKPTNLEAMMLDELRHVLLILRDRLITPKNYMHFMGHIKEAIQTAEKEIIDVYKETT